MYPASPVFYLEASLAGAVSPLLRHWAGHHVQVRFLGHQTQSCLPAQMVRVEWGLQCSALTPFVYFMAYACKGYARGGVAVSYVLR